MEIFYFSSGIVAVALIYAVAGVFKLRQQVDFLKIDIDQLHNLQAIEVDGMDRRIKDDVDDVYRTMDSRLDKLEDRLTKNS